MRLSVDCLFLRSLLFSKGIPYYLPNLDSVNHCTSKYLFISILISLLVQWLTESRFGKTKFGIPIEKRSLMSVGIGCTYVQIFVRILEYGRPSLYVTQRVSVICPVLTKSEQAGGFPYAPLAPSSPPLRALAPSSHIPTACLPRSACRTCQPAPGRGETNRSKPCCRCRL